MKARILIVIVAALGPMAIAAAPPGKPTTASDRDALQGNWRLTAVEINKQAIPLESLKDGNVVLVGTLFVKGNNYTFHLGKNQLDFTFRLDPSKTPRAIDLTFAEGPQKGQTYHGIYKLDGDTYTVCRPTQPGKARPTEFATRPDSGLMLVVWAREKPTASARPLR